MDWNDIQLILTIAEQSTLHRAAEMLKINHSTVWRRIQAIEKSIGTPIFIADRNGYRLTPVGQEVIEHASAMSANMAAIDRVITGQNQSLSGLIKLTTPTFSSNNLFANLIKEFRQQYPQITFELLTDGAALDLEKREADIAIRAANQVPDNLIGRELGQSTWSLVISDQLHQGGELSLDEIAELPLIGYINFKPPAVQWYEATFSQRTKVVYCNDVEHARTCALAGIGVALMPMVYDESLTTIYTLPNQFNTKVWLLAHKDLRTSAKIKAFWDFILLKHQQQGLLPTK